MHGLPVAWWGGGTTSLSDTDLTPEGETAHAVLDRAARLFDYLASLRALREPPIRDYMDHADIRTVRTGELDGLPGIEVGALADGSWLRIGRVTVPAAPVLPGALVGFVADPVDDPAREPELSEAVLSEAEPPVDFVTRLRLVNEMTSWLTTKWRPWALDALRFVQSRQAYEALYEIRLKLIREEAETELVWGHGILTWRSENQQIRYPSVTTRMSIDFDADTGALSVLPDGTPRLETAFLENLPVLTDVLRELRDEWRTEPADPWESDELESRLRRFLMSVSADGQMVEASSIPAPTTVATVTLTHLLFTRRRSVLFGAFLRGISDAFANGMPITAPIATVVSTEPSRINSLLGYEGEAEDWRSVGERLLMPLPTNAEQEQIVARLTGNVGVTVQGAPGTGKTHTIANLIAHLVAQGKRVLVTAQKEQPLKVLRDKVHEDVRELCVAVLGRDANTLSQLDQSLKAILERAVPLDRNLSRRKIASLEEQLGKLAAQIAELRRRQVEGKDAENASVMFRSQERKPAEVGRLLNDDEARLARIPDEITFKTECPITADELATLISAEREISPEDQLKAVEVLPDASTLPSGAVIQRRAEAIAELRGQLSGAKDIVEDWAAIDAAASEDIGDLTKAVRAACDLRGRIDVPWLMRLAEEVAKPGSGEVWKARVANLRRQIGEIDERRSGLAAHRVTLPEEGLPSRALEEQVERLRAGLMDSWRGVSSISQKAGAEESRQFADDHERDRADRASDDRIPPAEALPDASALPSGADIQRCAVKIAELRDQLSAATDTVEDWSAIDAIATVELNDLTQEVRTSKDLLERLECPWLIKLSDEIAKPGSGGAWLTKVANLRKQLDDIDQRRAMVAAHRVTLPEEGLPSKALQEQVEKLRARLAEGKGLGMFAGKEVKQAHATCLVNGEPARDSNDADLILTFIDLKRRRYFLSNEWNEALGVLGAPLAQSDHATPEEGIREFLSLMEQTAVWETRTWVGLRDRLIALRVAVPARTSSSDLDELIRILELSSVRSEERTLTREHDELVGALKRGASTVTASPLWATLCDSLERGDFSAWQAALDEATRLAHLDSACLVNGTPAKDIADVDRVLAFIDLRRRRYFVVNEWNETFGVLGAPQAQSDHDAPEDELRGFLALTEQTVVWETLTWVNLRDRLHGLRLTVPGRVDAGELARILRTLELSSVRAEEQRLTREHDDLVETLQRGTSNAAASSLWAALRDSLDVGDFTAWQAALDESTRLARLESRVRELDDVTQRLDRVAPLLVERIQESHGSLEMDPTLLSDYWEWRQGETWLMELIRAHDPVEIARSLDDLTAQLRRVIAQLCGESAWLALAAGLTDENKSALVAWAGALKRVRGGTGKYAPKWRAEAQRAMTDAVGAVPVWIMPIHRVVESFQPGTVPFDVVIIDESSQCDVFSVAVLTVAKKAIVVGDDKQISPQAVGINQNEVARLINTHIPDVKYSQLLDPQASLYDIGVMSFPGVIRLREHFRCLPEIIEFSNDLCYGGAILPLREEHPDPSWKAVQSVFLRDGYVEAGAKLNPVEIDAVVDKIEELMTDPAYDDKTMGVIGLLGSDQARAIEQELIERVGILEIERRDLRCGDAYDFQGDERDVMFLSLVSATTDHLGNPVRIGSFSAREYEQRINVAASRAKDQMWVFHSVQPNDLSANDYRSRLITYCTDPKRAIAPVLDLLERCESQFERDVVRQIQARGYRMRVQHKVGRFRIDIVVEGIGRRLAVECDGDAWHGADQWEEDQNRQQILERLGWRFVRIRGSEYYRNPERALEPLWRRLEELDIGLASDFTKTEESPGRPEPRRSDVVREESPIVAAQTQPVSSPPPQRDEVRARAQSQVMHSEATSAEPRKPVTAPTVATSPVTNGVPPADRASAAPLPREAPRPSALPRARGTAVPPLRPRPASEASPPIRPIPAVSRQAPASPLGQPARSRDETEQPRLLPDSDLPPRARADERKPAPTPAVPSPRSLPVELAPYEGKPFAEVPIGLLPMLIAHVVRHYGTVHLDELPEKLNALGFRVGSAERRSLRGAAWSATSRRYARWTNEAHEELTAGSRKAAPLEPEIKATISEVGAMIRGDAKLRGMDEDDAVHRVLGQIYPSEAEPPAFVRRLVARELRRSR